ncbi:hypothetical protein JT359_09940 [Candidatus Poribacteria bacterium]|nr:hypothetical protein [Candidatus Poribacteria bacterium]
MSEPNNFAFENFSFWKEKSQIDYQSLFLFLWLALNVWMKNHFPKIENEEIEEIEEIEKTKKYSDRNRLDMLKSSGGDLYGAFSRLIIATNVDGERFRSELGELHDALAGARIQYNKDKWINKTIDFNCCIIDWNNGEPLFESILFLEEIDDETPSINYIELNDHLSVENDPERIFKAYIEIVYQIRNILIHGDSDKNIKDITHIRVVRQLYITLSMVMEDI